MTLHFFHRIFSIRKMLNFLYKTLVRWKILAEHRRGNAWSIFFFFSSSFTPSSNKYVIYVICNIASFKNSYVILLDIFKQLFIVTSLVFVKKKILLSVYSLHTHTHTHTHAHINCVATYLSETAAKILVKTRQNSTITFIRY